MIHTTAEEKADLCATLASMSGAQLVAKIHECRDVAKLLLGGHFARDMKLGAMVIRGRATTDQCSYLEAALKIAVDGDGFSAIMIVAAYVEMTEPTK